MEPDADDETARLMARVEALLRQHKARPDSCCRTGCLHCPEGRRLAWEGLLPR